MAGIKGFTLSELVVVVMIVSILAAVVIPIMQGRVDAAKWSEGKASLGTIATALRTYAAENGSAGTYGAGLPTLSTLGLTAGDLNGTHFTIANYSVTQTTFAPGADPELTFTLTATAPAGITTPSAVTLQQDGTWTETP
jgi:type IV pilus assembly protein PilA